MQYNIFGEYDVNQNETGGVSAKQASFWQCIEGSHPGLSSATGCYIFGVRAGGGMTPWYVGQTNNQSNGFRGECFRNRAGYNDVLSKYKKGTPVLILIARMTAGGKFSYPTTTDYLRKELDYIESWLTGQAMLKNDALINVSKTKFFKYLYIQGFFNAKQGDSTRGSIALKSALSM